LTYAHAAFRIPDIAGIGISPFLSRNGSDEISGQQVSEWTMFGLSKFLNPKPLTSAQLVSSRRQRKGVYAFVLAHLELVVREARIADRTI
jgi:hypothetical protein